MKEKIKPTKLLSGGRVTMPQEWLDRLEIKDNDLLLIDYRTKHVIISKLKVKKA